MKIYVDADACPVAIKDIICRAAERTATHALFVANQTVQTPSSPWLRLIQVPQGFDVADNEIVRLAVEGDIVISSDIPLAAQVLANGCAALSMRGESYSPDSIQAQLTMRDFMDTLRASGTHTGGPPPLNHRDRQQFASKLDAYLAANSRKA